MKPCSYCVIKDYCNERFSNSCSQMCLFEVENTTEEVIDLISKKLYRKSPIYYIEKGGESISV